MRSKCMWLAVAAVLSMALVACGDDDEGTTDAAGETATPTDDGLGTEDCDAVLALGATLTGGPEGPPTPEYLEGELRPAVDAVAASEAEELSEPATEMQTAVQAAIDGEEIDEEAVFGLYGDMAAAVHSGCDVEAVDVAAVDYAFEGLPDTLAAGQVSFAMTNEGNEEHEMILFRRNDGETRSLEELLELPEAEAEEAVTFTGATFAPPGETGHLAADLEAGTYYAVCFIPVGGAEDGPPHFTEGMLAELEVT